MDGLKEDPDGESDSCLWDISGMADGTYYVYATFTDGISSDTSYAPGAITIDRTPPTVAATPAGGTYTETQGVTLSADEAADIYYTDGSEPTTYSLTYTLPIEVTETTTIRFMAVDAAGNKSEVAAETYTIGASANIPPEAYAGDDITISFGEEALLSGSANDPDDGPEPLTCNWQFVNLPLGSALSSADISGIDTLSASFMPDVPGAYELQLTVSDGLDFAYNNITITVETGEAIQGDLDGDGDVDRDDLNIIPSHRNQPASVCPECDLDGDGMITALDARKLVLLCTRPRCACEEPPE